MKYISIGPFVAIAAILSILLILMFVLGKGNLRILMSMACISGMVFMLSFAHYLTYKAKIISLTSHSGAMDPLQQQAISRWQTYPAIIILAMAGISILLTLLKLLLAKNISSEPDTRKQRNK